LMIFWLLRVRFTNAHKSQLLPPRREAYSLPI
jgi:hypothetical protein